MDTWFFAGLAALGIANLATIALAYHKLSGAIARQRLSSSSLFDNNFRQVEALLALYAELDLPGGLPPTRGWAGSPDFLLAVCRYVLDKRPRVAVECSSGVSTLVLARCMQLLGGGNTYSLEHDREFAEKTRALLRRHGLEAFATVLDAPLQRLQLSDWSGDWYAHQALPRGALFDLLLVDGPPHTVGPLARYPALPVLFDRLAPGATVFVDDADRADERACVERWMTTFDELRLESVPACEKGCVALSRTGKPAGGH